MSEKDNQRKREWESKKLRGESEIMRLWEKEKIIEREIMW